jgi:hypothetical protein
MTSDEIRTLIDKFDSEVNKIRSEAMQFAWFMRGGLSYEDAMLLSLNERMIVGKLIKDNIETTKKSGMPFI